MDEGTTTNANISRFLELLPRLDREAGRVAVQLLRLLSKGESVSPEELAVAVDLPLQRVTEILNARPGGIFHEEGKIIGFLGLTPKPLGKHRFTVDERTLYTWCALDSLFLPEVLANTARVESVDPQTGQPVRMTVHPNTIEDIEPVHAVVSILNPTEDMLQEDVVSKFCHYIHFFVSEESGQEWCRERPGTWLLPVQDAFALAKRMNQAVFQEALVESDRRRRY